MMGWGSWSGVEGGLGRLQLLYKQSRQHGGAFAPGARAEALLGSIWIGNGEGKVSKSVAGGRNST